MIYPSIDKLLNIVDSKYELVHIAVGEVNKFPEKDIYKSLNPSIRVKRILEGPLKKLLKDL